MDVTTSYEFLINQKSVPDKSSIEYDAFWENEWLKADRGVTINGTYISGWLYWHLNLWTIYIDDKKSGRRKKLHPYLRDNEWMIAEYREKALSWDNPRNRKGLIIVGSRRLGKSDDIASIIGRSATLYEGSESIVAAGNENDIKVNTTKLDLGLKELPSYFQFHRIANNWKKEVELGFKDTDDVKYSWSRILIRNLVDGTNTEALAGATPTEAVIDEIGKNKIAECLSALLPGLETPYGWRSSPILAGTGGSFDDGQEAEDVFNNPEAFNFLGVHLKDEPKKYGLFIPGHMSLGVEKDVTTLGAHLGKKKKSELDIIPFYKTNWERGEEFINQKLEEAKKSPDTKAVLKVRMYYPTKPEDCFLSDTVNNFPIEACKAQLAWLDANNIKGQYIRLYRKLNNSIGFKFAEQYDLPIMTYPTKPEDMREAPVVVWEMPVPNAPRGLYVAGADPIAQDSVKESDSLGTVCIFKRITDLAGDTYQYMPVASLACRPRTLKVFHEQVELLLEFYNAICMPENETGVFIQYFDQKHKGHLLADGYNMLKEISPNTSIKPGARPKGMPATIRCINYGNSLAEEYTKEDIPIGQDPTTKMPIIGMGVRRVLDRMLLQEMIKYKKGANADRLVAFRHALICAKMFDKFNPTVKVTEEDDAEPQSRIIKSPFSIGGSPFSGTHSPFTMHRNPFGVPMFHGK